MYPAAPGATSQLVLLPLGQSSHLAPPHAPRQMPPQMPPQTLPQKDDVVWDTWSAKLPTGHDALSQQTQRELFDYFDVNKNGYLSLDEVDQAVRQVLQCDEMFKSKQAVMRAFKAARQTNGQIDGTAGANVERSEFPTLLNALKTYFDLYSAFTTFDTESDGRLTLDEFRRGVVILQRMGIAIPPNEVDAEFALIDANYNGIILFDEFANWACRKRLVQHISRQAPSLRRSETSSLRREGEVSPELLDRLHAYLPELLRSLRESDAEELRGKTVLTSRTNAPEVIMVPKWLWTTMLLQAGLSKSEAQLLFEVLDNDADGRLSLDEIEAAKAYLDTSSSRSNGKRTPTKGQSRQSPLECVSKTCPKLVKCTRAIVVTGLYFTWAIFFYRQEEEGGWTPLEAIYFAAVTMSTVGYGDYSPSQDTVGGMPITVLFIFIGFIFVFAEISGLVTMLVTPIFVGVRGLLERLFPPQSIDLDGDGGSDFKVPRRPVIYYGSNLIAPVFIIIGGQFFWAWAYDKCEGWGYGIAFYHCMTTATTVGYGDVRINVHRYAPNPVLLCSRT